MTNRKSDNLRKRHHAAKLTVDQAFMVEDYYAEGYSQKCIAENFSVSPSTINKLLRRKTWRWINDYAPLPAHTRTHTEETDK